MSAWDDPVAHICGLEAEVAALREQVGRVVALACDWQAEYGEGDPVTVDLRAALEGR